MANLFVIVATAIAWWSLIPQIVRLVRTGDPSGVSSAWPAIGLATNAGWTAYLSAEGLWAAVPSTAVMTISYSLVIWALRKARGSHRRGFTAGLTWGAALVIVWTVAGWSGVGLALAASYVVQFTPAVVAVYRSAAPTGLAPATWISIVIESMLWGAYGTINADLPVVAYAVVGVVGGGAILARYRSRLESTSTGAAGNETTKQV